MAKGFSLRKAAQAAGTTGSSFHGYKVRGIVAPDVADDKGNFTLYSEAQIERAKQEHEKNTRKKSADVAGNNLFEDKSESSELDKAIIAVEPVAESITLDERANRIRRYQDDVQRKIIEIGNELIAAKKEIGHGNWAQWIETEFYWTQQTANRFMRVAERFGNLNNVVQFQPSQLQAMLLLPEGDETAFIEQQTEAGHPVEKQSAREVQAAVKKWNQRKDPAPESTSSFEGKNFQSSQPALPTARIEIEEKPVGLEFKLAAIEQFESWLNGIEALSVHIDEAQLNFLLKLFGEYWHELEKQFTYESKLIRIAERIKNHLAEICNQTAQLAAMVKIEVDKLT